MGMPVNCVKTTDAFHGTAAVKLTTVVNTQDTMFGYFVNANPNGDPNTWHGGIPYAEKPSGMRVYYKSTITAGDTAFVIVAFSKAGVNIGSYTLKIYNNATTYTLLSSALSPALTQTPDSVVVAATSGNPFSNKMVSGSVLYLDSFSFTGVTAQPAMLNGDFEQWDVSAYNIPVNWYLEEGRTITNIRSTDAYKGTYSVRLTTNLDQDEKGNSRARNTSLSTGYYDRNCNQCDQKGGYPFNKMTDTLVFWYKYTANATNGKASVMINLKKNGTMMWGASADLPAASTWQYYFMPILPSQTPDTLIVRFQSSRWEDSALAFAGSVLTFDEVQLKSAPLHTGIFTTMRSSTYNVYPNPARNVMYVNAPAENNTPATLRLMNAMGQTVLTQPLNADYSRIDLGTLSKGMYFYVIESNASAIKTGSVVIE